MFFTALFIFRPACGGFQERPLLRTNKLAHNRGIGKVIKSVVN